MKMPCKSPKKGSNQQSFSNILPMRHSRWPHDMITLRTLWYHYIDGNQLLCVIGFRHSQQEGNHVWCGNSINYPEWEVNSPFLEESLQWPHHYSNRTTNYNLNSSPHPFSMKILIVTNEDHYRNSNQWKCSYGAQGLQTHLLNNCHISVSYNIAEEREKSVRPWRWRNLLWNCIS